MSDNAALIQHVTSNDSFQTAVQNAFNHIIITDLDGKIVYANSAAENLTGYTFDEMKGKTPRLWGRQMSPETYNKLWHTIKVEKKPFIGEFINKRKNGVLYNAKAVISPIFDKSGELLGFIGTEEDITDLKNVDKMKSEFISIAAHQLKTPISALSWNIELVQDALNVTASSSESDKKVAELLASCLTLTGNLNKIVSKLLNISRIESGRLSIHVEEQDLIALLNKQLYDFKSLYVPRNIKVSIHSDFKEFPIKLDSSLISEVFKNILSNAIKYSPDNSEIVVGVVADDKAVTVAVSDKGLGIPLSAQKDIFKKFYRADNTAAIEGTGLGLYFCKSVLDMAKGKIWFESKENEGTVFYFSLPLTGMAPKPGEVGISAVKI